mmetsp:Transcript_8947/g.10988  ORF Transcript_8947/g.10988 Transcript_8947/m.10988 type:complete len:233 (+) Transcript_8947:503-1201(+)
MKRMKIKERQKKRSCNNKITVPRKAKKSSPLNIPKQRRSLQASNAPEKTTSSTEPNLCKSSLFQPTPVVAKTVPSLDMPEFNKLSPRTTQFFPFLTLPKEVTLKRSQRTYPIMDKINSVSLITPSVEQSSSLGQGKLFEDADTLKSCDSFVSSSNMSEARHLVTQIPIKGLKDELHNLLKLLGRQRLFLEQSLANMEFWCQTNFSDDDYRQVYGNLAGDECFDSLFDDGFDF